MIFMPEENKMALIMEAMKGYMPMDMEQPQTGEKSEEMTDMERTRETKTIAGKNCEVWLVNDG